MAKMTKKQRKELEAAVRNLQRGAAYVNADHVAICRRKDAPTTTADYTGHDGNALTPILKEAGSDLVGIFEGLRILENFLFDDAAPKPCSHCGERDATSGRHGRGVGQCFPY